LDNKLKTSLNAYMAKHGLNTNAASIAIGVSVPTLRKALRGHNVSRKTTAKIESIIASGKVPEAAKTTVKRTPKKTAAAKPLRLQPLRRAHGRRLPKRQQRNQAQRSKPQQRRQLDRQKRKRSQQVLLPPIRTRQLYILRKIQPVRNHRAGQLNELPAQQRLADKRIALPGNHRQPVVLTLRVSQSRPPNGRQRAIIVSPFASSLMSQPSKHKARPTNVRRRQQTVSLLLIQ